MVVLTITASLLGSTLAPAQPLPPLTRAVLDVPAPRAPGRAWIDGGRLLTTLAVPVGRQETTLPPAAWPRLRGSVDGGRLPYAADAPPPGRPWDTLPRPLATRLHGFVDGGRLVYAPSDTPPPGRPWDALPPRTRGTWQITLSVVPVEEAEATAPVGTQEFARPRAAERWRPADPLGLTALRLPPPPPPPSAWPLPVLKRVTQHGSTQDAYVARSTVATPPPGRQWDTLPRPRRLAPRDWIWPSSRVTLTPVVPPGRQFVSVPVLRARDRRPLWIWGPPPSSLLPPPITFDCLHVAVVAAWPRVVAIALDSPGVVVDELWPRVVTVTLTAPGVVVVEAWPRVTNLDGC
jgi:hypothetical protein